MLNFTVLFYLLSQAYSRIWQTSTSDIEQHSQNN